MSKVWEYLSHDLECDQLLADLSQWLVLRSLSLVMFGSSLGCSFYSHTIVEYQVLL